MSLLHSTLLSSRFTKYHLNHDTSSYAFPLSVAMYHISLTGKKLDQACGTAILVHTHFGSLTKVRNT